MCICKKSPLRKEGSISIEELLDPQKDRGHMYIVKANKLWSQGSSPSQLLRSSFPSNTKSKVETSYRDNDLILTPIISPQSGWQ
jgi:hypothetical protein